MKNKTTKDICLMFTNDALSTHSELCHLVIDLLLKRHKGKLELYVPQIFQLRMQKHLNYLELSELQQTEHEKYKRRIQETPYKGQFVFFSMEEREKYHSEFNVFAEDIAKLKGHTSEYLWNKETQSISVIYPEAEESLIKGMIDKSIGYNGDKSQGVSFGFSSTAIENLIVKTIEKTINRNRVDSFMDERELKSTIDAAVRDAVDLCMFNYFERMESRFQQRVEQWSRKIATEQQQVEQWSKRISIDMEQAEQSRQEDDEYFKARQKFEENKLLEEKKAEFEKQQEELKKQEELKRQEEEMLLTAEQVAAMVGCDTQTIYHRAEKGFKYHRLPFVKKGLTAKRFKKREVLDYFEKYPPIKRTRIEKRFPKPIPNNYEEKSLLNKYEAAKLINCDHSTIYHRTRKGYNGHKLKSVEVKKGAITELKYPKDELLKHFRKYPYTITKQRVGLK